jgi:hypothetical protein
MNHTAEYLAKEAERLTKDLVLITALADMRKDALADLVEVDATFTEDVLRHQSRVKTIDEFLSQLERYILALPDRE